MFVQKTFWKKKTRKRSRFRALVQRRKHQNRERRSTICRSSYGQKEKAPDGSRLQLRSRKRSGLKRYNEERRLTMKTTTKKLDPSFARIPAILLWVTNALHLIFTAWAIDVGGSGMEMAVLFPLTFIEIPGSLILLASLLSMLIVKKHRRAVLENAIPFAIYVLQVAVFWLFAYYK